MSYPGRAVWRIGKPPMAKPRGTRSDNLRQAYAIDRTRRAVPAADIRRMVRLRRAGHTNPQIAKLTGWSYQAVYKLLRQHDLPVH